MGAITDAERMQIRNASNVGLRYDTPVNRESAAEILQKRAEEKVAQEQAAPEPAKESAKSKDSDKDKDGGFISDVMWGSGRRQGVIETIAQQQAGNIGNTIGKSVGGKMGGQVGRQIFRNILGSIFSGRR